jgi:H+/Cl- antiporter ClcA
MDLLRPFYEARRKVLLMFKIRIERYTQWQATAALLCFVTSVFAGIVGSVLTTSWVLSAQLHPLLHAIGLTLLIIAIPVLLLGGHCLDLMERRQKNLKGGQ